MQLGTAAWENMRVFYLAIYEPWPLSCHFFVRTSLLENHTDKGKLIQVIQPEHTR